MLPSFWATCSATSADECTTLSPRYAAAVPSWITVTSGTALAGHDLGRKRYRLAAGHTENVARLEHPHQVVGGGPGHRTQHLTARDTARVVAV